MQHHTGIRIATVALTLLFALPASAQGQNDPASQLAGLLGQIKALQAQLAQLLGAQGSVVTEVEVEDGGVEIISRLRLGSRGEEVRALQELLAKDAMIYPDGLITGYFGPRTAEAVKRLQEKFGLEAVGEVGPLTREKIKEWRKTFKRAMQAEKKEMKQEPTGSNNGTGSQSSSSNTGSVDSIINSILGESEDVNDADVSDSIPSDTVSVTE